MKMRKWSVLVLTLGLAAMLGLYGCSSASTESADEGSADSTVTTEEATYELLTDGVLTVATSPDYPPFENLEDGEYVGFDIDLAEAVGEKLGLEVEFVTLQFDGIITAIAAGGQADMAISGMTVDAERAEQIDFTDSYYIDDLAVAAMEGSGVTSDTAADELNQEGVIIAVQSGTSGETYCQENYPNATTQAYGNSTDAFAAMQAGQADYVCTNYAVVENMLADAYSDAEIVLSVATGEEYAMVVSQDNPELTAAINEALAELEADGTIDELLETWF